MTGSSEVQVLECKTAGINGAKLWRGGVPEHMQLQVMHQLAVTGQAAADVAALVGGNELRIFKLLRDEALIERLIPLKDELWRHVEDYIPPPADASNSAEHALRNLYPDDDRQVLDLSDKPDLVDTFEQPQAARSILDNTKQQETQLKYRLQQAMGMASEALFPDGSITWKKSTDTRTVDMARLKW